MSFNENTNMVFYQVDLSRYNYWHSIVLFGRNVVSYKCAIAKSIYELNKSLSGCV
jgi:hypothetical protein